MYKFAKDSTLGGNSYLSPLAQNAGEANTPEERMWYAAILGNEVADATNFLLADIAVSLRKLAGRELP